MGQQATLSPTDVGELREVVVEAAATGRSLEFRGGGSKQDIGKPDRDRVVVDLAALTGVVDYEPSELVLTARPATPLAEIEALLASRGQMLAFEPWDHGPLFGRAAGAATIGGVVASGIAGSRRVSAGGARDHLLGFTGISGRAEEFKAGGKVVKNVTGYDVSKVLAGSWGQLAVMTELTLKVVPKPRMAVTLGLRGLPPARAVSSMAKAMGSATAPAAAAHLPASDPAQSVTAIRLEGFPESVEVRARQLAATLAPFAQARPLESGAAASLWESVRHASPLFTCETVWRVHVAPSQAVQLTAALDAGHAAWLADWAGALIWTGAPADLDVRAIAATCGAHAMLVRAPLELRRTVPARHPEAPALAALSGRVKAAFDPAGILDPERFN